MFYIFILIFKSKVIWFGTNLERHQIRFQKGLDFGWAAIIYFAHSTSSQWVLFEVVAESNHFLCQRNKVYCIKFYVREIFLMSQNLCYKLPSRMYLFQIQNKTWFSNQLIVFKGNEICLPIFICLEKLFLKFSFYEIHKPLNSKFKIKEKRDMVFRTNGWILQRNEKLFMNFHYFG